MKAISEDDKKRLSRCLLYRTEADVYAYCVNNDLEPYYEEVLKDIVLYFADKVFELQEEERRKEECVKSH
jgi:hypothetical protein